MKITFPDGKKKEFPDNSTPLDIAKSISDGLARVTLAAEVNGKIVDAFLPIKEDASLRLITFKDKEGKDIFWHSTAHILAQAVLRLYPEAKLTIGPVIEPGFYYDIDFGDKKISENDFEKIEKEMEKIVSEKHAVSRKEVTKAEAKKLFAKNEFKLEMIEEMEEGTISIYSQGEFTDLCRGPHIPNTGLVKAIKLTKLAGAYWRGDAKNKQLTRIYGISYPDKKELNAYLKMLEEAKKRDHRVIGKNLDLFSFSELSPGCPFFHPKGAYIYNTLVNFIREEYKKRGYQEVVTPTIFNKQLWETSGHWEHYKENMFMTEADGQQFSLKPMNCPSHALIFKTQTRSYRELPLRIADFGVLHRNELKGVLGGLTRVRKFQQDDAHIFCTPEQIQSEIEGVIDFVNYVYRKVFRFEFDHVELSTKPEKALGDEKLWAMAEESLHHALINQKIDFKLNPGEGAFYGPKIDFHVRDAIGRTWQLATIQLDFNLANRFDAFYEGQDGRKHHPVVIHRAVLGTIERFMGVFIEHTAGKFPLWLNPNQVIVLTVADRHNEYAMKVVEQIRQNGFRVDVNFAAETIPKKVREAQLSQYNYILVVGDREMANKTATIRTRDNVVHGEKDIDSFIAELIQERDEKR